MRNIPYNLTKNSLIVDSGFWIALFSQCDVYHEPAKIALTKFSHRPFVVTWPVIVETSHLLLRKAGCKQQLVFLQTIQAGGADIFHLDESIHLSKITVLMEKYQDLPMDLADASLVILAEHLGHGQILSTDQRDFRTYRWKNHEPFENLLLFDG